MFAERLLQVLLAHGNVIVTQAGQGPHLMPVSPACQLPETSMIGSPLKICNHMLHNRSPATTMNRPFKPKFMTPNTKTDSSDATASTARNKVLINNFKFN